MPKHNFIIIAFIIFFSPFVRLYAAPTESFSRTIIPINDRGVDELGSSTRNIWGNSFFATSTISKDGLATTTISSATSTFANGLNLDTEGCFAILGICLSDFFTSFPNVWSLPGLGSFGSTTANTTAEGNLIVSGNATTTGVHYADTFSSNINATSTLGDLSVQFLEVLDGAQIAVSMSDTGNADIDGTLNVDGLTSLAGFISSASSTVSAKLGIQNDLTINAGGANDSAIYFRASDNNVFWSLGADVSDVGKFKIASSSALGSSDVLTITGKNSTNFVGFGSSSPWGQFSIDKSNTVDAPVFVVSDYGSSSQWFVVNEDGNVGIGTAMPQTLLDVADLASLTGFISSASSTVSAPFHVSDVITSSSSIAVDGNSFFAVNSGKVHIGTTLASARKFNVNDGTDMNLGIVNDSGYSAAGGIALISTNDANSAYAPLTIFGNDVIINSGAATGNVGIRTANPQALLDVQGAASSTSLRIDGASSDAPLIFATNITGQDAVHSWTIGADQSDGGKFKIASSTALGTSDRFVIDGAGNVGIGTASPAATLDIVGGFLTTASSTVGGTLHVLDNLSASSSVSLDGSVSFGKNYGASIPTTLATTTLYGYSNSGNNAAGGTADTTYYLDDLAIKAQGHTSSNWRGNVVTSVLKGGDLSLYGGAANDYGNNGTAASTYTGGNVAFYSGVARNGAEGGAGTHSTQINYGNILFYTPTGMDRTDETWTEFMRIDGGGFDSTIAATTTPKMGVGTTTPWRTLSVVGTVGLDTTLTNAVGTPGSLCYDTASFEMTKNNALTCTVSSRDQKNRITSLNISGIDLISQLNPVSFRYNDRPDRIRYGFIAEEVAAVDPRFADAYNEKGQPRSLDQNALLSVAIKAIQEQNERILALEKELKSMKTKTNESYAKKTWALIKGL